MLHSKSKALRTALVSAVACAAAPLALAAPPIAAFEANLAITEQVAPGAGACMLMGDVDGVGSITGVGAVTSTSSDCINPLSTDGTTSTFSSSDFVIQTASGDKLFGVYGGTMAQGVLKGSYVIYGGTGAFRKATGLGTITGYEVIDPVHVTGEGAVQLKGTIRY